MERGRERGTGGEINAGREKGTEGGRADLRTFHEVGRLGLIVAAVRMLAEPVEALDYLGHRLGREGGREGGREEGKEGERERGR